MASTLICSTFPSAFAALSSFTTQRSYLNQFVDVASDAWYYDNVKTAYELGLVNGSSTSTYSPDSNITVAEVQTIVARIHATYHGNEISAVDGAWYTPYIEYCIEHIDREICSMAYMADGDEIMADMPASRAYFAYLMYSALPSEEYTEINSIADGSLPDVDAVLLGSGAPERIYTLYRAGILTGSDEYGTFHPYTNITRAEVAAIISRMIDPVQRKSLSLQQQPQISLENYIGNWYFVNFPDSGVSIEKSGSDYYLSLTLVQGAGLRINGTLEPVMLTNKGEYYESAPFDTIHNTTAIIQIRPDANQLVVSCSDYGDSNFLINFTDERCNRG